MKIHCRNYNAPKRENEHLTFFSFISLWNSIRCFGFFFVLHSSLWYLLDTMTQTNRNKEFKTSPLVHLFCSAILINILMLSWHLCWVKMLTRLITGVISSHSDNEMRFHFNILKLSPLLQTAMVLKVQLFWNQIFLWCTSCVTGHLVNLYSLSLVPITESMICTQRVTTGISPPPFCPQIKEKPVCINIH